MPLLLVEGEIMNYDHGMFRGGGSSRTSKRVLVWFYLVGAVLGVVGWWLVLVMRGGE